MKAYFLSCLFYGIASLHAQEFPKAFLGHWDGELLWYQAGKPQPQKVRMQLVVRPADTAGHFTWQIIYGDKGADNRPYVLKPVDTAKGHWVVDERNGILLDQYWIGNRFTSTFTVGKTTILDSYRVEGDSLIAEYYSLPATPVRRSGHGTEDSPHVDSYATRAYQKAVLRRKPFGKK